MPVIFGVTLAGFLLMVYFGPDRSLEMAGRNPTAEEIQSLREQLGMDRPVVAQYLQYLRELATGDFGHSTATGESVGQLLKRAIPVSAALLLPGFILGHLLAAVLAGIAAFHRDRWPDRAINAFAMLSMSISFVVVMISLQLLLSSRYGLNWFPARGWRMESVGQYLSYVAVPTAVMLFVAGGYNTRFYRSLFVEELGRDHIKAARGFGLGRARLFWQGVLPNCLLPALTRIAFSIPSLLVGGSLLIESYFGIPGVGKVAFDAITNGDQPVLKAIIGLSSLLMAVVMVSTDRLYRAVDPRLNA